MQLSRYIKTYPSEESPDRLLLFSTRTVSKILLGRETWRTLQEGGTLSPSDEALLTKLGFLVSDRDEGKKEILRFFDTLNAKNTELSLIVVLNLDCNFACTYCYEGEMKGQRYMSEETADALVDFIKARFPEGKKSIVIDFYGGEPLLSVGLIRRVSNALKPFAETRGAKYGFTLVTNGSLFTGRIAEELAPLGLTAVKITLDGPAEIHDRCRPFKSGRGSFDTIVANIAETCALTKIGVSGNYQKSNYPTFPSLLDHLTSKGLTPDRIAMVKFDPVMKPPDAACLPDGTCGCSSIDEPWLVEASLQLREEILKRGYRTQKMLPLTCMIETTDSYVVHYDGTIYKCPGFIGRKDYEVGHLREGVNGTSTYRPGLWKNDNCIDCSYLPLCFGGCRFMKFIRDGNLDGLDCQKAYLDAALETLIKQELQYSRQFAKPSTTPPGTSS